MWNRLNRSLTCFSLQIFNIQSYSNKRKPTKTSLMVFSKMQPYKKVLKLTQQMKARETPSTLHTGVSVACYHRVLLSTVSIKRCCHVESWLQTQYISTHSRGTSSDTLTPQHLEKDKLVFVFVWKRDKLVFGGQGKRQIFIYL